MLRAASQTIQSLYEQGSLSYPRSASDALSEASIASLVALLPRVGLPSLARASVPRFEGGVGAHEAVHPMPAALRSVNLGIAEWMLQGADRILHRATRHLLRCVAPIDIERPADTRALPAWAVALDWRRPSSETAKALLEAEELTIDRGVTFYPPEEIAFRALLAAGLGRPSSVVEHAVHAAERGAVDGLGLTSKGRALLAATPPELANPACSLAVEAVLERAYQDAGDEASRADPMALVNRALSPCETLRPQWEAALRIEARRHHRCVEGLSSPSEFEEANATFADDRAERDAAHRRAVDTALEDPASGDGPSEPASPERLSVELAHLLQGPSRVVAAREILPGVADDESLSSFIEPRHASPRP